METFDHPGFTWMSTSVTSTWIFIEINDIKILIFVSLNKDHRKKLTVWWIQPGTCKSGREFCWSCTLWCTDFRRSRIFRTSGSSFIGGSKLLSCFIIEWNPTILRAMVRLAWSSSFFFPLGFLTGRFLGPPSAYGFTRGKLSLLGLSRKTARNRSKD